MVRNINAFDESCSPNSIFKWENWFQEDRFTFNLKNSLWNLKMPYFWWLLIKLSYKMQTNPFQDVDLEAKVHWISTASLWNSTTVVILTFTFKAESISICICICLHTSKRQKYDRNVWSDPFYSNAKYFPLTELMDWQNDDESHAQSRKQN